MDGNRTVSMIHRHNAVLGVRCFGDNIPLKRAQNGERLKGRRRRLTDRAGRQKILFFRYGSGKKKMTVTQRRVTLCPPGLEIFKSSLRPGHDVSPDDKSCPLAHNVQNDKYLSWLTMECLSIRDRNFAHFDIRRFVCSKHNTDERVRNKIRRRKSSMNKLSFALQAATLYLEEAYLLYFVIEIEFLSRK